MKSALFLRCLFLPVLLTACDGSSQPAPNANSPQWELPEQPEPKPPSHPVTLPPSQSMPSKEGLNILPLARILEIVRRDTPGEVLEVEQDDDDGLQTYEVQILTPDDRRIEIKLNARTGAIIERDED